MLEVTLLDDVVALVLEAVDEDEVVVDALLDDVVAPPVPLLLDELVLAALDVVPPPEPPLPVLPPQAMNPSTESGTAKTNSFSNIDPSAGSCITAAELHVRLSVEGRRRPLLPPARTVRRDLIGADVV